MSRNCLLVGHYIYFSQSLSEINRYVMVSTVCKRLKGLLLRGKNRELMCLVFMTARQELCMFNSFNPYEVILL